MYSIGKVISVSYDKLIFEVSDFNKLLYNLNGDLYVTKGVSDYVVIKNKFNEKFVYQVIKVEDKEIPLLKEDEYSKFDYQGKFECIPIGMIINNAIEFNINSYPFLRDNVYLASKKELDIIFLSKKSEKSIHLGYISDIFPANIDLSRLLLRHSAILGNTGSGKSTTIRRIISEVKDKNTSNLNLHIFDVHNEYYFENPKVQIINVKNEFKINISDLTMQDWINLIKPSELVQLPIIQMALKIGNILIKEEEVSEKWLKCYLAYNIYYKIQTDSVAKRAKIIGLLHDINEFKSILQNYTKYGNFEFNYEDTFCEAIKDILRDNFDSRDLFLQNNIDKANYSVNSFELLKKGLEYAFLIEECKGNTQVRAYCGTLETRIKNIQTRYSSLLGSESFEYEKNKSIFIYSISELDDDLLLFFTSYLLKKKFEFNVKKQLEHRNINVFIFEEAHKYISRIKENSLLYEIEIFKKISREGRKFGCFMIISSQRPSELSSTVLSQCNNYIIHRIKNNIDLEYMIKTIPYIDKNQMKRLSYLPTGISFVVGDLSPIPVEINVVYSKNSHISATPSIKFKDK